MSRISFIFLLFVFANYCNGQSKSFVLKGTIKQLPDSLRPDWLYLSYTINDETKIDSVRARDGKYVFSGTIAQPVLARIRVQFKPVKSEILPSMIQQRDIGLVFLEYGSQQAVSTGSMSNIKVNNSEAHKEYVSLMNSVKSYNTRMQPLYDKYGQYHSSKDKVGLDSINSQIILLENELKEKVYAQFVKDHPRSPVALYAVEEYAGWNIDPNKAEPIFNLLSTEIRKYPGALGFQERLELAKKTAIGQIALDFVQNDTLDQPVKLSSFRGKYVLLEFWASWCIPCRAESPNLLRVFNKYKDKNFHILGISLDRPGQRSKWVKAIRDDGLIWTQVSDLKFFNNEVARKYGVTAIPQNLLLDPEGRIIAKNLRGDDLENKLAEVIAEKRKF